MGKSMIMSIEVFDLQKGRGLFSKGKGILLDKKVIKLMKEDRV